MKIKNYPFFQKIIKYFLQGVFTITPVGITLRVVINVFNFADNIFPNILHSILPDLFTESHSGKLRFIPGIGLIITLIIIIFLGWLSSLLFVGKVFVFLEKFIESTPGIKFIYGTVKEIMTSLKGDKNRFNKPVLVSIQNNDVWQIGFITHSSSKDFGLEEYVAVYVPFSYAISGITYLVPINRIRQIPEHIKGADAMKFVVSGGLTEID